MRMYARGLVPVFLFALLLNGGYAAGIRPVGPDVVRGEAGVEFDVYVRVEEVSSLFGVSFVLSFDRGHLSAISESAETFVGSDVVFFAQHDNTAGTVAIGVSRKAGQGGVSGTGNVARVRFQVTRGVTTDTTVSFILSAVDALDPSGASLSLSPGIAQTILRGPSGAVLLVTPAQRDVSWGAGSTTFEVSNAGGGLMQWTASVTQGETWLSITSGNSGANMGTITVTYTANPGPNSRVGTVTVVAPGATGSPKSVMVAQAAPLSGAAGIRPVGPDVVRGEAGVEFDVYVRVEEVSSLFGVSFVLSFDRVHLSAISESAETFIGSDVVFFAQHDNTAGTVAIGVSRKAGQGGVTGTGNVARVRFQVTRGVTTDTTVSFALSAVDAMDPSGSALMLIPRTWNTTLSGGLTVWPGDANNDGLVNIFDINPIVAKHWNRTGPQRPNASLNWVGQVCSPWTPPEATYADTDGNGLVNIFDINAVPINFGRTHTGTLADPRPIPTELQAAALTKAGGVTVPPITAKGPQQIDKGQEFWLDIDVGSAGNPVTNLKVVSFELTYTNTAILDYVTYEVGPFLTGAQAIVIPDDPNGKVSASVYRTAGSNTGYGVVLRLKFRSSLQAVAGQVIAFAFAQVLANREDGTVETLSPIGHAVTIVPGTGIATGGLYPEKFELLQNHPNPFNPETVIEYRLPCASRVTLAVYNLAGVKVATLREGSEAAGCHRVVWDGRDELGRPVAAGVYVCRFTAGAYQESIRMVLIK